MKQIILRSKLVVIVLFIAANAMAQNNTEQQLAPSDTSYTITFNWELENEEREEDNTSYQGANICSRWIKFPDNRFSELKSLDGKEVRIVVRRSVWEGLESKKARGIDTKYMQGTPDNISCNCILTVKLEE